MASICVEEQLPAILGSRLASAHPPLACWGRQVRVERQTDKSMGSRGGKREGHEGRTTARSGGGRQQNVGKRGGMRCGAWPSRQHVSLPVATVSHTPLPPDMPEAVVCART